MCMEDIRIGRKKYTRVSQIDVTGVGSNEQIGASESRTHISIWGNAVGVRVFPKGSDPTRTPGMTVFENNPPISLDIEVDGDIVTGSFLLLSAGANAVVMVVETFLAEK